MPICECGKSKHACFNINSTKGRWCSLCPNKPKEAIDVIHKKCQCGKSRPTFNLPDKKIPLWCAVCPSKPKEAVNTKDIKCTCGKIAKFGLQEDKIKKWCSKCKPNEAIDLVHKKCQCGKNPSFNLPGQLNAKWCAICPDKPKEAVNIKANKCQCGKIPNFNLPGESTARWCATCPDKPNDAIDVRHKKCRCGKIPNFNLPGESMARWCATCPDKPKEAIDVNNKQCRQCEITRSISKYDGYCVRCYVYLFPDKPVSRNYKVKENYVFDAVLELLPKDINIIRDKIVGGCSKRRPDLMIDCVSHWICAENDENCHKTYDNTCENKRIMELYTDMGNRPMILIRFNCDKYSDEESLFKKDKRTDIDLIRDKNKFKERITKFAELIRKYIQSEPPEKSITFEYLYYN